MSQTKFIILIVLGFSIVLRSQNTPFDIQLTPMNIEGVGGLQAFAFGQYEGKWLVFGGRLDGLHRRQPFASFDINGHNNQFTVVDPLLNKSWTASMNFLPVSIKEQLSATNMEFFQEGKYLYVVGGYGYSATTGDHTTYPYITAIDVEGAIEAIIQNLPFQSYFRQIRDEKMAVTGGYLHKINDIFHLVGGQKFIGRYNPMGPTHGPGFFQEYTNAIRKFTLEDDGNVLNINHYPEIFDSVHLHRRDYNVVPQIMPDGKEGLTAFSGVFQQTVDLPYLTCVNINNTGYEVQPNFFQYYNHYHCAHIPLYSTTKNEMHTVFFGGIAQYYDNNGILVKDDNVPFVNTIARVTRKSDGTMAEYKLPVSMPALLGAGSEFIPLDNFPSFDNGVIKLDELSSDTTMVGYIYGGISSSAPNIFFVNTGNESNASRQIFKVHVIKNKSTSVHDLNSQSQNGLGMMVYPNPGHENISVKFELQKQTYVALTVFDMSGVQVREYILGNVSSGSHSFHTKEVFENHPVLIFQLRAGDQISRQKVILR
ncbi:MAG: T9SS C-terminal target domain-containing protein [Saprospiraceae bacterium]|nr:T9SS C-terminal target domain-containing protein [Saprospiraceae bacterium]MBK8853862.1 T9SS C-terminal target domain-containing protein [Saprospiraceae bacterium]